MQTTLREAELLRLDNPHACLWRGETPRFSVPDRNRATPTIDHRGAPRKPLVFVHGMEYHHRSEVLRDLIKPFEEEAKLCQNQQVSRFDYYFLHWDSRLDGQSSLPLFPLRNFCRNATRLGMGALQWGQKLMHLEMRARAAALSLQQLVRPLFSNGAEQAPVVVTHSLGALVWSETLKSLVQNGFAIENPGTWWNLQPAIAADAFGPRGTYDFIPDLYARADSSLEVWHSRLDIVLATLFLGAKGTLAMGQIGTRKTSPARNRLNIDLTSTVREAHGQTFLVKNAGPFFRRASRQLHQRAQAL